MTFQLPEIQLSFRLFSLLKIVFLVSTFIVIMFNVLSVSALLPENTTDWNWGIVEGIKNNAESGYPNELIDDDLEEQEELEDEKEHSKEAKEWDDQ